MKKIVCDICGRPADYMCKVSVREAARNETR